VLLGTLLKNLIANVLVPVLFRLPASLRCKGGEGEAKQKRELKEPTQVNERCNKATSERPVTTSVADASRRRGSHSAGLNMCRRSRKRVSPAPVSPAPAGRRSLVLALACAVSRQITGEQHGLSMEAISNPTQTHRHRPGLPGSERSGR
jgi:hypothetical protein